MRGGCEDCVTRRGLWVEGEGAVVDGGGSRVESGAQDGDRSEYRRNLVASVNNDSLYKNVSDRIFELTQRID